MCLPPHGAALRFLYVRKDVVNWNFPIAMLPASIEAITGEFDIRGVPIFIPQKRHLMSLPYYDWVDSYVATNDDESNSKCEEDKKYRDVRCPRKSSTVKFEQ